MSLSDALKLARKVDLIGLPRAKPLVGKIMSYDKYRYQEEKNEKQRASEKPRNQTGAHQRKSGEHDLK